MEPTGHYWLNVSRWLSERQFEVVLVNPHLVKKNKENRDNTPSKSDKKDALVIADMVKNDTTRLLATHLKLLKSFESFSQSLG
jgi:transposase